ncbi:kinesin-like protein KIFC3 [Pseudoscourfieldia marina]
MMASLPHGGSSSSAYRPEDVLALPCVLTHCHWMSLLRDLPLVCSTLHRAIGLGTDTSQSSSLAYLAAAHSLAEERALALPLGSKGAKDAKRIFNEHIWTARNKWRSTKSSDLETLSANDFDVKVAVRFRPTPKDGVRGNAKRGNAHVVPLHQRIKLLRAGEQLPSLEETRQGLDGEEVARLVEMAGNTVDPDVLRALLDAQRLEAAVAEESRLDRIARARDRASKDDDDDDGRAATGGNDDDNAEARAYASALGANADSNEDGEQRSRARDDNKENGHDDDDDDDANARRRTQAQVLAVRPDRAILLVPGVGVRAFAFGGSVMNECSQGEAYADSGAADAVAEALNGFNSTLLFYGQTGGGKTHTAFGSNGDGCVPRACSDIFNFARRVANRGICVSLSATYVQVYGNRVIDLWARDDASSACRPMANGEVHGAVSLPIEDEGTLERLLKAGEARKRYAATAMNATSSRAHTLLSLRIVQSTSVEQVRGELAPGEDRAADSVDDSSDRVALTSRMVIADLAGAEQLKLSKAEGVAKREAIGINGGLLALGKCVRALAEGKSHIPFHDSALTTLLKAALVGNSRTHVVLCCASVEEHALAEGTLNTLRFGERVASLQTHASAEALYDPKKALAEVESALARLELRVKTLSHSGATDKLRERIGLLARRRDELRRTN